MTKDNDTTDDDNPNDNGGGTNKPWDRTGGKFQNPDEPKQSKPDLEKWQKTQTH